MSDKDSRDIQDVNEEQDEGSKTQNSDQKGGSHSETISDQKGVSHSETKSDQKGGSNSETKSDQKGGSHSETNSDQKGGSHSETKPDQKGGSHSETKSDQKGGSHSETKSDQKKEGRDEKTTEPSKQEESNSRNEDTQTDRKRKDSQTETGGSPRHNRNEQTSPRNKSSGGTEDSDGRSRQKEFFREELKRLESSLKREKSKIVKPEIKKHTPYIFNTLEPYYNTATVRYLVELPDEVEHRFISRKTAIGLCDPWVDHDMDTQFLPKLDTSSQRAINRQQEMDRRDQKIRERERRSKKEGSTMLPKFPVVTMESKDLNNKPLYFSDVPMLRKELRQKYSQNADRKVDADYQRTKKDFYRMDLDKIQEVHPINRPHMRNAYFAYLQNTPGSKKAVHECVRGMRKEGKAH